MVVVMVVVVVVMMIVVMIYPLTSLRHPTRPHRPQMLLLVM
jgi:hypothetical protein